MADHGYHDWKNCFPYLRYLIVPVCGKYRILSPYDGQMFTIEVDSLEDAKTAVEGYYLSDLMMNLLDAARDRQLITQEQLEQLTFMVNSDLSVRVMAIAPAIAWVSAIEVADQFGISANFLHTLRREGKLKQHIHWRVLNFGSTRHYQYNLTAFADLFVEGASYNKQYKLTKKCVSTSNSDLH